MSHWRIQRPNLTAEFVLTEEHTSYAGTRGRAILLRKGVLAFDGVRDLTSTSQLSSRPSRDPHGSVDYGNLDYLIIEGDHYTVEGNLVKATSANSNSTLHQFAWRWSRTALFSLRAALLLTVSTRPVKDPLAGCTKRQIAP